MTGVTPSPPRLSRRSAIASLAAAAAALPTLASARSPQAYDIIVGLDSNGLPTQPWLNVIRGRVSGTDLATIAATAKPLSADESAWVDVVRTAAGQWLGRIDSLNAPFRKLPPPPTIRIVLGNQGGDDAFGMAPDVLAFDLSSLASAYGVTDPPRNLRLMQRLLAHEYMHILTIPWLDSIGWSAAWAGQDPFLRAVRTLYNEGLGNLRSIEGDDRWISGSGDPTGRAAETLTRLQPIMLERLQALRADPSPEQTQELMRNISQGPFAGKWGALPIALWLALDTGFVPDKLAVWIEKGPAGILELAVRYADEPLRPAFQALLAEVAPTVAKYTAG